MIACNKELTKQSLSQAFRVDSYHPFSVVMEDIINVLFGNAKKITREDVFEKYECIPKDYEEIFNKNFKYVYEGELSTEGYDDHEGHLEAYLAYSVVYVNTSDLIVVQLLD
jgi:hypothetical protein